MFEVRRVEIKSWIRKAASGNLERGKDSSLEDEAFRGSNGVRWWMEQVATLKARLEKFFGF